MRRRFAIGISIVFVLGGGLHHGWLIVERAGVPGKAAKCLAPRVATSLAGGPAASAGGHKKSRTKAVPLLREMLHARDSSFKTNLVNLLSQQSFVKMNIVMARERRIQAGLACIELGPKGPAIQNLLEFTKGGSFCANVGEAALGRIGAEAVGPLCLALTDDDPKTRQVAAGALGNIGTKAEKAIPELTKHLRDEYGGVRAMAARALGRVGVVLPEVVRALVEALGDADPRVRSNADVALTSFGVKAVPMLQTLLEEHDPDLREGARKVIDEIEKMKEPPRTAIPFRQIL